MDIYPIRSVCFSIVIMQGELIDLFNEIEYSSGGFIFVCIFRRWSLNEFYILHYIYYITFGYTIDIFESNEWEYVDLCFSNLL
ncbi:MULTISPECIES: hypothetical protein [unclassified Nitratiruptor]|uniref:hypothetical protein n=1 Tax=Nitratiruptor sp. YY08-13 TaxID=2724898 RepID=UPI001916571A|nr:MULTISPECIES: hypothetical protein [unclassified Nitratiruptor]